MAVAVVLALVARRVGIPPAVAFVPGGMILAITPGLPAFELDPALCMTLFLPPLLQFSAFFTVWRDFRANIRPILFLAVGAVAFTTLVVGWVMKLLEPSLPWAACFTLGAIISPPDAVAAGAVLEHLRIPRRLLSVLEGESLVNDASGLVLYRFGIAVTLGGTFDAGWAAASFALVAVGGIAIGIGFGWARVRVIRFLNDTNLEITASFLAAWASYIAAESVGASGVLSTVACGLVLGWRQHETFSPQTRQEARAAWGFITFVLEALVFVLIGLSLHGVLARLAGSWMTSLGFDAVAITLVAILARFVWVFPTAYVPSLWSWLRGSGQVLSPRVPLVVAWAGMRGVVSLAAALALPEGFPARDQILLITFVVILGTVMIQGPTLGPLIQRLRLARGSEPAGEPEDAVARRAMAAAELRLMEERANDPLIGAIARDILDEVPRTRQFNEGRTERRRRAGNAAGATVSAPRRSGSCACGTPASSTQCGSS